MVNRRCKQCGAILSMYNPGDICTHHETAVARAARQWIDPRKRKPPIKKAPAIEVKAKPRIVYGPHQSKMMAVASATAARFKKTLAALQSDNRTKELVRVRDIAIYLCIQHAGGNKSAVGRFFNKSHATVIHSIKKVEALLEGEDLQVETALREIVAEYKNF